MKKIFAFFSISLLAFSCQRQADPFPAKVVVTPKTAFQVGVKLYDQYNQLLAPTHIGQVRLVLSGEQLQRDTIIEINSFLSSRIRFDSIPIGQYQLTILKEGYVGEHYTFKLVNQDNGFLMEYDNRQTAIPPFSNVLELKLGQISTLPSGQLAFLQQDAQNVYLKADFPAEFPPLPYIQLFFNKGNQVSVENHVMTYAYFFNKPVLQLWQSELKAAGFQKGDTVSVIGYGDNYVAKELVSNQSFSCLSKHSSNLITFILD